MAGWMAVIFYCIPRVILGSGSHCAPCNLEQRHHRRIDYVELVDSWLSVLISNS
jgi:hypothetical protein